MRLKNEGGFGQIRTKVYVLAVLLFHINGFYHFNRNLIISSVCPVSKDALTHRLAFPRLYLKCGGIYENQVMHFSYYPMNLYLLYLISVYLGAYAYDH